MTVTATPSARAVQRGEREQLVAVDDRAGAVDGEHAVAVAVEREADVVAVEPLGERLDVGRADAVVDVAPVGLVGDDGHVGAEAAEDLRARRGTSRRSRSRAGPDAAEVERREALVQAAQVVLLRAVQRARRGRSARPRRCRGSLQARLDRQLGRRRASLKPSPPKNLIPLSRYGLCEAEMTAARSKP